MVDGTESITEVVVDCSNQNLSEVPQVTGISTHPIYELTLANNNIQSLNSAALNGLKIQRLNLLNNNISNIDM